MEIREQVLQQAQRKVKALEDGRDENDRRLRDANLDGDTNAVKSIRDAEKQRKEGLAEAERERTRPGTSSTR